jgi:sugar lactone lactonase YvrE
MMRLLPAVLIAGAMAGFASGQTYTIRSVAGVLPVNVPGASAGLGALAGTAVDSAGNVFIAATDYHIVLRLDANSGVLTLVAGDGTIGFSGDNGPATSAQLNGPSGVAVDSAGNLYIADDGNYRIRKVSNGVIATIAGIGVPGFTGDYGPATSAQLGGAGGMAVDAAGKLYFSDGDRIRVISDGSISTVAGDGTSGFSGDNGPATGAQLWSPIGVAVDTAGNLFIADYGNNRVREVSNGVITTVAGNGTNGFSGDNGPATSAQLSGPSDIAADSAGDVYFVDSLNNCIRKISNGVITTVAGNGTAGFSGDNGPAAVAELSSAVSGVAVDSANDLFIADGERIRRVFQGVITTVAGNGTGFSGDNGPATSAQLDYPSGLAVDAAGNLSIADTANNRIREISNGVITTVAGNGTKGFSGDNGPATSAQVSHPEGLAVDAMGNLYIADTYNGRVREVSNGVITTVAGDGICNIGPGFEGLGYLTDDSGDNGPATSAQICGPAGLAVDTAGNLYIGDIANVRKVSNGVITTVAGNGRFGGIVASGDNGPATDAELNGPLGVTVDPSGDLFIAESGSGRVRKVSNGIITTVAGSVNVLPGFNGDGGPATGAQLDSPIQVMLDSSGNLYIADAGNGRIRRISGGVITTIAGGGATPGDNGPATSVQLAYPSGLAMDSRGDIYVAESGSNRVRVLIPSRPPCTYAVNASPLTARASGGSLSATIQTGSACAWAIQGLPDWITISGSALGSGSSTVALAVAADSGTPRTATISIAGVSFAVEQQGLISCTYSVSPGGEAWPAAGGAGTINLTASNAACAWSATSAVSWVTVGPTSGTGSATLMYQLPSNSGAARSGVITVADLSFTVEEAGASTAGLTTSGSMAQLASGGAWTTTITLVNTGSAPAQMRLNFFDNNGNPLLLPLTFPQTPNAARPLLAATLDRTLNAGAELVIQSSGPLNQPTLVGWAQLLMSTGSIGGFAVFGQALGSTDQEAAVPLENRNASAYLLSFDTTNGSSTGVALANITPQPVQNAITVRDDTGTLILADTITLPGMGHTSFDLVSRYGSVVANRLGTVEFTSPAAGEISVLGLRFSSTGAFSSIPAIAE